MKYECHGVWPRPNGFVSIGQTEVTVEGGHLLIRVEIPGPIVLGKQPPQVTRITLERDEDLWN